MYVRAGRPAFARPCVGIHKSTSLMSSSLLLQQCPACLVRLTWIVFVIGGRWPYSWCLVGCCCQDMLRIARSVCVCVCVCEQDLALNNPLGLICHKTQSNQRTLVGDCSVMIIVVENRRGEPTLNSSGIIFQKHCLFQIQLICNHSNSHRANTTQHLSYPLGTDSIPAYWRPPAPGVIFHFFVAFFEPFMSFKIPVKHGIISISLRSISSVCDEVFPRPDLKSQVYSWLGVYHSFLSIHG